MDGHVRSGEGKCILWNKITVVNIFSIFYYKRPRSLTYQTAGKNSPFEHSSCVHITERKVISLVDHILRNARLYRACEVWMLYRRHGKTQCNFGWRLSRTTIFSKYHPRPGHDSLWPTTIRLMLPNVTASSKNTSDYSQHGTTPCRGPSKRLRLPSTTTLPTFNRSA